MGLNCPIDSTLLQKYINITLSFAFICIVTFICTVTVCALQYGLSDRLSQHNIRHKWRDCVSNPRSRKDYFKILQLTIPVS